MLQYAAAVALAVAWLGYSRASKASVTPGAVIPPAPTSGVPDVDSISVTGIPTEIDTLARTIWGEARGEGYLGMQAVANVVINRVKASQRAPGGMWWGNTIAAVCLAPQQFSAWDDTQRPLMLGVTPADQQFRMAQEIALKAVLGQLPDNTMGATHYHTLAVRPSWADASKVTAQVGQHIFYA